MKKVAVTPLLLTLCLLFGVFSCKNESKTETESLVENNAEVEKKESKEMQSTIVKDTFWFDTLNSGRFPNPGTEMSKYQALGEFSVDDNLISIDIPVSEKDFDLNNIEKYNISTSNHNILLVVLTRGDENTTSNTLLALLKGDLTIKDLNFNESMLKNHDAIKVYVIHDECYDKDSTQVNTFLKAEMNKLPAGNYPKSIDPATRTNIEQIRASCDSIKPVLDKPKEIDGGVITGR
ncbi:hypothetical protein [Patiriisocius hiemis]|uniref:Uncharacterized protein n=1 Tax=Patiriisocius hiemis TaxID=3075604 RepID=A0ABU2YF04_9FLAO|nr:hypothetical protein [Constantimarinum sp. W242]MDT0556774.1 hypothetical protein [Constantimarinum sp. W242]